MGILGESTAFRSCYGSLQKLAHCKAPVLIEGETGTGKDCAARCMHYLGPRQGKPLVPVNCGAIPDTVFENELFGHARGAYTDAATASEGLVDQAREGTLFLDEVDGITPRAQVALLRFLEDNTFRRLGDSGLKQADVHIIAATNADLDRMVAAGGFRQDLLFRLSTVRVRVPSLRERRADIGLLARHYVYLLSELYQTPPKCLDPAFAAWLERQEWPGNIRELQNCLHRAFLLADGDIICGEERECAHDGFRLEVLDFDRDYDSLRQAVIRDFECQYLTRVMQRCGGNISQAARLLGKDRRAVGRLLQKNGVHDASAG
jgi:DNA-binding NtrC family response regulator